MIILVADTSVLIDLERGSLFEAALSGPHTIATPDLLYARELVQDIGPRLLELGLQLLELDATEVTAAQTLQGSSPKLSLPDCAAYIGARRPDHHLLSGDGALRTHAEQNGVNCHGLLWLFDRLHESAAASAAILYAALTQIVAHPRCRLPPTAVEARLRRWR